jgi:hypothetical protein
MKKRLTAARQFVLDDFHSPRSHHGTVESKQLRSIHRLTLASINLNVRNSMRGPDYTRNAPTPRYQSGG